MKVKSDIGAIKRRPKPGERRFFSIKHIVLEKMLSDTDVDDHYNPTIRSLDVEKNGSASSCGFHLTRSKWDPYPWVSGVDASSAAAAAGMQPGDCLLEVNGEDVVGQRISDIADLVKSNTKQVSLLLWNAGANRQCRPEVRAHFEWRVNSHIYEQNRKIDSHRS